MKKGSLHLKIILLLNTFLVFGISSYAQEVKKNVLLIMVDDFNHWIKPIGYYPDAITPNINQFASEGVLFRDASSSSPVCHPSRNAMWSGIHPLTSGISGNADDYIRDVPDFDNVVTMNQYFSENGYYTYGGGKLYHPGSMGGMETDPDNWTDLYRDGTGSPGGPNYRVELQANSAYKWGAGTFDIETSNDTKLARHFANKISTYDREEPFFMAMGLFRPHLPWNCHKDFYDLYNPEDLSIPQGYLANDASDINSNYNGKDTFAEVQARGIWKEALRAYLANMSYADFNVGIVLDALKNSEVKENTIVVFVGDHGWHIGEKDRMSKHAVFDEASRTTLIIYDPGASGNGKISKKVVSLQDIYPTLVSLTGLQSCTRVQGNDLSPLLEDPELSSWNKPIFMKYGNGDIVKTNEWRFIESGDESQLYHISDDPYEFTNLYGQTAYAGIVNEMKGLIQEQILNGNTIRKIDECIAPEIKSPLNIKNSLNYLFPNPTTEYLIIPGLKTSEMDCTLFDLTGKKIFTQKAQKEINVSFLKKGEYVLRLSNGTSWKFIKE